MGLCLVLCVVYSSTLHSYQSRYGSFGTHPPEWCEQSEMNTDNVGHHSPIVISDERKGHKDVDAEPEHRADDRCAEATGSRPDSGGAGTRDGGFQTHDLRVEVA